MNNTELNKRKITCGYIFFRCLGREIGIFEKIRGTTLEDKQPPDYRRFLLICVTDYQDIGEKMRKFIHNFSLQFQISKKTKYSTDNRTTLNRAAMRRFFYLAFCRAVVVMEICSGCCGTLQWLLWNL